MHIRSSPGRYLTQRILCIAEIPPQPLSDTCIPDGTDQK